MKLLQRLVPRTLFGRLTVVLVGGMVASQVAGAVLLLAEFRRSHEMGVLRQHAEWVRLLVLACDAMTPTQRMAYVAQLRQGGLSLRLDEHGALEVLPPSGPAGTLAAPQIAAQHDSDTPTRTARLLRQVLMEALPAGAAPRLLERAEGQRALPQPELLAGAVGATNGGTGMDPPQVVEVQRADYRLYVQVGTSAGVTPPLPREVLFELVLRLGLLILFSLAAARLATGPLATMARQLGELDAEAPERELPARGPQEVRDVALRINDMRRRILSATQQRTALLAGISHDLRTPLTRLRLRMELMEPSPALHKCIRDVEELQQMVEQTLSFVQAGQNALPIGHVDLVCMLDEVLHDLNAADAIPIKAEQVPCMAMAQALSLKRALLNVLENALRYADRTEVRLWCDEGFAHIDVLDEGPGVPEAMLDTLTLAFVRVESSRSRDFGGAGLGLAIAKSLMEAQQGSLTLANRREPRGLQVRLSLRRAELSLLADSTPIHRL